MQDEEFEKYFKRLLDKFEDYVYFESMGINTEITKKEIKQILEEIWQDGYNEGFDKGLEKGTDMFLVELDR